MRRVPPARQGPAAIACPGAQAECRHGSPQRPNGLGCVVGSSRRSPGDHGVKRPVAAAVCQILIRSPQCAVPAVAPSLSCLRSPVFAGRQGYCATKGGARLFAKAVAMECAAEGDAIRVNTVHPGGHRHADFGRSYRYRPDATCRSIRTRLPKPGGTVRKGRAGAGYRKWRALPRFRCVQLHDRSGTGDRRRHDRRRTTSLELRLAAWGSVLSAPGMREFC
jgi:NAD(P)-dependent dehydrogenase (short-subunit alcohol dehydrogenase family)